MKGKNIEKIAEKMKAIGKAGSTDDVTNNQHITNTCSIISEEVPLTPLKERGTIAETSLTVIKLTSTSVRKSTDTPKIDIGNNFSYKSAAKTPRLAVGMKAAFFYDFVDRHIDRIYNIDRLRRIFYV